MQTPTAADAQAYITGMERAERPTHPIIAIIISLVGMLLAGLAPALFGIGPHNSSTYLGQFVMTASFAVWIIVLFVWVKFKERRSIASIGFVKRTAVTQSLLGLVLGVAMTSAVVGINLALSNGELGSFNAGNLLPILFLLVGFFIQSSAEEIAYRGYLGQAMAWKWTVGIAIVAQAVLFTVGHVGNGLNPMAIVTMMMVSYFLMMWILDSGSLWGAMFFHAFWNWSQANFWGASVSNFKMDTSVFHFNAAEGTDLLTGGSFGLEGSIITNIFLLVGGIIFHLRWLKKRAK